MSQEVISEMLALNKELVATNKEFNVQICANTHILCAMLNVIPHKDLQFLKSILKAQSEGDELQGLAAESCRRAVELVSMATEEEGKIDPRKMLNLIPGGKKP